MSASRRGGFIPRTLWAADELDRDRRIALGHFRRERLEEPLEQYAEAFEQAREAVASLLAETSVLADLAGHLPAILTGRTKLEAFRYLAGPPISLDDLKTLVDVASLSAQELRRDPDLARRLVSTILDTLDRRRFPWVAESREATEGERQAATLATAALIATQRVATSRRNEGKEAQEEQVRRALLAAGLIEIPIPSGGIPTLRQAPQPGHFCREVSLSGRKADLVVGLWDGRVMPIECKVSNSEINSIKRLNNDAAAKAETWRDNLGSTQVVPVAVLSGVYKLRHLEDAQERGLTLYWAHRLDDLVSWIAATRAT